MHHAYTCLHEDGQRQEKLKKKQEEWQQENGDQAKGQHGHGAATWKREGGVGKAVRRTDDGLGAD